MENTDLFEDFGIKSETQENKKHSDKNFKSNTQSNKKNFHKIIGKKKKREKEINNSDSEISTNKNNNNNENIKNTNENSQSEIILTSKEEDILISKQITKIFPNFDFKTIENQTIQTEITSQINMNMHIEKETFEGGFHEMIYDSTIKSPQKLIPSSQKPATTFKFKLDNFQERAILCLENHQSVLVAAHTSAGKTVVAQYAIAMALRDKQRVIYTSPIKALSNQKYRDLISEFKDVGLMTGDVAINTNASCLVMTTEILRNMLFKGTEITKEIAWVIFDEVHYMRDKERGVIWEETIILLSNKINYVFLSATIPNAREFAMWISKIKQQPCNVVYTDFRPVPLQHYIFPKGGKEILKVVDSKSRFKDENFRKALEVLRDGNRLDNNDFKQKYKKPDNEIKKIVDLIIEKKLDPAIIFSFSKRECENNAIKLFKKKDYSNESDKELINKIFTNAINTLSEEDQKLECITKMQPILLNGIGIHHGGMLPILKECVELLFQEGLLKILFSTETFSMGINMPAKTVVFTSVDKWDGDDRRWLGGGEYIQMSGRAGRRGIDEIGIVIVMINKEMEPEKCKNMLKGKADPLNSSFHFNYNQLVNLFRLEGMESEFIVKRSFLQFQNERNVPMLKEKLFEEYFEYKKDFHEVDYQKIEIAKKILDIKFQIENLEECNRLIITKPENIIPYLVAGRLIKLQKFGFGIVISYSKKNINVILKDKKKNKIKQNTFDIIQNINNNNKKLIENNYNNNDDNNSINDEISENNSSNDSTSTEKEIYIVDTAVFIDEYIEPSGKIKPGDYKNEKGKLAIVPFALEVIENISPIKLKMPESLKEKNSMNLLENIYLQVLKRCQFEPPLMDPINELKIEDKNLKNNTKQIKKLKNQIDKEKNTYKTLFNTDYTDNDSINYMLRNNKIMNIKNLIQLILTQKKLVLEDDLINMNRVLRRLDFVEDNILTQKGQVACGISGGDELLITEILFNGNLNDLDAFELPAILTVFLSNEGGGNSNNQEEKNSLNKNLKLKNFYENTIKTNAERIGNILLECKKLKDKEEIDEYVRNFKSDFIIPVYKWANGENFEECLDKNIYEGSLVRVIRRLDEYIKNLIECVNIIGNINLKEKLEVGSKNIKRGMPFAGSLYLPN